MKLLNIRTRLDRLQRRKRACEERLKEKEKQTGRYTIDQYIEERHRYARQVSAKARMQMNDYAF